MMVRGKKEPPRYCVLMVMIEAKLLTVGTALAGVGGVGVAGLVWY